jgi:type IV pilus assembly protein PilM
MPALAIDIGTYTIKAISGKFGLAPEIERSVEVFNSVGAAVPNDDAVSTKLGGLIDAILADNKLPRSDVRVSLPETVVSTNIIAIPSLNDAELASAIGWQAEQHIPIPPDQLSLQYQVLYRPKKNQTNEKMRVLLVGAHKEVVKRYVNMFIDLGIEPKLLETQMLSVLRAAQIESNEPTTLVVHMGASSTQMAMVHEGELKFVTSHMTGGQVLTQALERQINLDSQQAEEYKRTYGLNKDQFEGKVRAALLPVVDILVKEMSKSITFFTNQNTGTAVQRILLSGGAAQTPGLIEYITQKIGAEVLVLAPFATAKGEIPQGSHSSWTVCMGLLMREEL